MKNQIHKLQGIISISSKGTGYIAIEKNTKKGEDIEINFEDLNTALNGDTVEIILHPKKEKRQTGEVINIISRAKNNFIGILEKENGLFFLKPDDIKMYTDILIPEKYLNNAKVGEKVFVKIISWINKRKMPEGSVLKILGQPGDNNTEMHAIAIEKGFDLDFNENIKKETQKIKENGITQKDYLGRKDFRKTLTFTIDPNDAKDFDDAISFKKINENLYEIGVHIADVSHYVKLNSAIDKEAYERGTSVYLVDRTIPMLPEILSNDLCSLVPNKDRLTMSVVFVVDKNANIKNEWYGKTIIHSQKRFTYEEAEENLKNKEKYLHKELFILNHLAKKLNQERFKNGAISLEQEEVKFILDKNGIPLKIIKKERGDSNKLIEEFMLLANKKIAELLSGKHKKEKNRISLYRIHDFPSKEKMADLIFFLKNLGYKISLQNNKISTYEINKLLENLKGKNEADTIYRAVIKSMAKAIYSTKNIGHYGLAFSHYTHFTSPIRRYPDIVIHRLLTDYLNNKKIKQEKIKEYEKIAEKSSEQEKKATDAERTSIKYKQVEYMSKHIGKKFDGIISGVTEWGLYVEEKETKCEGLIKMKDMMDDFYIFNEKKLELIGQKNKKRYRLGDRIKIQVKEIDLERKTIDYVLT